MLLIVPAGEISLYDRCRSLLRLRKYRCIFGSPCSLARSRMASIHSSLSRILHSRPSHQVFRIYLTPSRSVTDNAPSFVASNRSAGTVPRSSRCFRTCSCRRSCSSRPVYSLKIRQPCCVSHRIAHLPFRVRNTSISYCSSSATALSFTYNPS